MSKADFSAPVQKGWGVEGHNPEVKDDRDTNENF